MLIDFTMREHLIEKGITRGLLLTGRLNAPYVAERVDTSRRQKCQRRVPSAQLLEQFTHRLQAAFPLHVDLSGDAPSRGTHRKNGICQPDNAAEDQEVD